MGKINKKIERVRKHLTYLKVGSWAHNHWSGVLDKLREIKSAYKCSR